MSIIRGLRPLHPWDTPTTLGCGFHGVWSLEGNWEAVRETLLVHDLRPSHTSEENNTVTETKLYVQG